MKNQDYLLAKYAGADEEFASADGMNDDLYADGDFNADGMNDDLYAGGSCGTSTPTPSKPFIIKLYNSTANAISNVSFLNAVESVGADNDGVTPGIVATYEYPNITYATFLKRLQDEPFIANLIRISATSTTQIETVLSYQTRNSQGKFAGDTFVPQLNTFQQINTKVDVPCNFPVNNYTELTFASIEAGVYVTISIYPSKVGSSLSKLGKKEIKYTNPNISGMRMLK